MPPTPAVGGIAGFVHRSGSESFRGRCDSPKLRTSSHPEVSHAPCTRRRSRPRARPRGVHGRRPVPDVHHQLAAADRADVDHSDEYDVRPERRAARPPRRRQVPDHRRRQSLRPPLRRRPQLRVAEPAMHKPLRQLSVCDGLQVCRRADRSRSIKQAAQHGGYQTRRRVDRRFAEPFPAASKQSDHQCSLVHIAIGAWTARNDGTSRTDQEPADVIDRVRVAVDRWRWKNPDVEVDMRVVDLACRRRSRRRYRLTAVGADDPVLGTAGRAQGKS